MRRLLFIVLLLALAYPAYGVVFIGGGGGAVADDGLNDFSGDTDCYAVWNFESGALDTDSKGSNTYTFTWITAAQQANTVDFKQGSASIDLELANDNLGIIDDGDLDAGFPLKSGDTNKEFSIVGWVMAESLPANDTGATIVSKWNSSGNQRSMMFDFYNDSSDTSLRGWLAYNNGASSESKDHASSLSTGAWYHVTFTYEDSGKAFALRVRDTNCSTVGSDVTGTYANAISIESSDFRLGSFNAAHTWGWDGEIDELVVFDDVLTESESTKICNGTYP